MAFLNHRFNTSGKVHAQATILIQPAEVRQQLLPLRQDREASNLTLHHFAHNRVHRPKEILTLITFDLPSPVAMPRQSLSISNRNHATVLFWNSWY